MTAADANTNLDRILSLSNPSAVHLYVDELTRQRALTPLVLKLNDDVLCGDAERRTRALGALMRIGFVND